MWFHISLWSRSEAVTQGVDFHEGWAPSMNYVWLDYLGNIFDVSDGLLAPFQLRSYQHREHPEHKFLEQFLSTMGTFLWHKVLELMGSHSCCDKLMILIFYDAVLPGRTFLVMLIHRELPPIHWRAKKLNNWWKTEYQRFWMFGWLQGPSLNLWRKPTQVSYGWLSVRDSLFVVIPKNVRWLYWWP